MNRKETSEKQVDEALEAPPTLEAAMVIQGEEQEGWKTCPVCDGHGIVPRAQALGA